MSKRLKFEVPTKKAKGNRVMGLNDDDTIFEGIIRDVITYSNSSPTLLKIEGLVYDGIEAVHFIEEKSIDVLKVFDEEEYSEVKRLINEHAIAVELVAKLRKQYRRMMV